MLLTAMHKKEPKKCCSMCSKIMFSLVLKQYSITKMYTERKLKF
jgi:hypothetical protein